MAPERICVENLGYGFERVAGIAADLGLSICCDIGHLMLYGVEVDTHLDRYFPRTRVIHLHGFEGGVDHRAVSCLDPALLESLMQRFSGCRRSYARRHDRGVRREIFPRLPAVPREMGPVTWRQQHVNLRRHAPCAGRSNTLARGFSKAVEKQHLKP